MSQYYWKKPVMVWLISFVRFPWLLNALDPEYVASQIVDAMLRNQQFLILPRLLYVFMALKG